MGGIIILVGIAIYFIPTIVGWKTKDLTGIFLLNLFLGWTILGWLGALIWAASSTNKLPEWTYTCSKCGYKNTLNQKITLHVCPQCKNETSYNNI